ncbi:MAG: pilus assembly protein PilM [Candidatus Paceibacterota bacterium]
MSVFSVLSDLIPPPSYITLPSVGVDISDTSLKYVSFQPSLRNQKTKILKQWGDIDIPANSLDRGEIINPKQLADTLREFKKITKADFIRVSLPEERAYIFETELKSNVPQKEILSLLEFRLEENVPIAARDTIFDYEILPVDDTENNQTAKVVVAAYQRDTIMQYYEACRDAGLTPIAFEVEAQAMARAMIPEDERNTVMLVDFGKTRTGVGIAKDGVLLYTSTIDIGGGQLSQVMRRVLGDNVAESELTNIKNTQGLIKGAEDTRVYDCLIPTISVVKDEIATRMQYWHTKDGNKNASRRIKKVILCGGSSNLKGLPEYMSESLGLPCVRGNVWENAFKTDVFVPPIEKNYSFGYATAIGLALHNTV